MRKSTKLMAGLGVVAGLAVAAAPLAVNAGTLGSDHLQVTVNASCTLNSAAEASYAPWDNAPYTLTLGANAVDNIAASGTGTTNGVTILCNEAGGYQITASGTDLVKGHATNAGSETNIGDAAHEWYADTDADSIIPGSNPAAGTGTWGAKLSKTSGADTFTVASTHSGDNYGALTGGVVASNTSASATAGDVFTIVGYRVSTKANQKSGTYQGTATYSLVHPIPAQP